MCYLQAYILATVIVAEKSGQHFFFCQENYFLIHFNSKHTSLTPLEQLQTTHQHKIPKKGPKI
jgi:hypothetical protein